MSLLILSKKTIFFHVLDNLEMLDNISPSKAVLHLLTEQQAETKGVWMEGRSLLEQIPVIFFINVSYK